MKSLAKKTKRAAQPQEKQSSCAGSPSSFIRTAPVLRAGPWHLDSQHVNQFLHGRRALLQSDALFGGQGNLDHLLETFRAQFAGHANVKTVDAIFAFEIGRAR